MNPDNLLPRLKEAFPDLLQVLPVFRDETTVVLTDKRKLPEVVRYLKNEGGFDYLVDICAVDNAGETPRFEVVYEFYSYGSGEHLRLKVRADEDEARVPSIASLYATANWHEREAFDMMGITFDGHPDLRRILMWDGYPYYPLRKEFPLEGLPSALPDGRFTKPAPMEGGPFVTCPADHLHDREPRSKSPVL
jgi:NADH-quinone oxidoreductase subunit C